MDRKGTVLPGTGQKRKWIGVLVIGAVLLIISLVMAGGVLSGRFSTKMLFFFILCVIAAITLIEETINVIQIIHYLEKKGHLSDNVKGREKLKDCILSAFRKMQAASESQYSYQLLEQQAQMNAMQSQIRPHFLYNTLDSVRGLAIEEEAYKTSDMVEALAALFRSSIGSASDMLTVAQEIKNVDNYIRIQKYRLGDHLRVTKQLSQSVTEMMYAYKIPKLTLQPILENSIKHGFGDVCCDAQIEITAYTTQSRLIFSIKDNGQGMTEEELIHVNHLLAANVNVNTADKKERRDKGFGLYNINYRIKFLFGDDYGLTAYSAKDAGTEIIVSLPLMSAAEDIR